ncbi:MAG: hypothetical protein U0T83_07310 [Bacteriovoracaceae bacterium]
MFCEWFYLSQKSLIEHSRQYDPYCICLDPMLIILKRKKYKVRLPFGNLANRFILNRCFKNPHHDDPM